MRRQAVHFEAGFPAPTGNAVRRDRVGTMKRRCALGLSLLAALACGGDPPIRPAETAERPESVAKTGSVRAAVAEHEATLSSAYAESSALVAMTADGSTELGLRIARFPATGKGTLWLSAFVGDERYGVAREDLDLAGVSGTTPVELSEARFAVGGAAAASVECRERHTAAMVCTARAEAMTHEDFHPPLGAGTLPLEIEVVFHARHAGDRARAGRMEVFGTVEGTITTPRGVHRFSGRGKYHEQTGERPRFAGAFTYFAIQGDGGSLLARVGEAAPAPPNPPAAPRPSGATWGFALLDGETVAVKTFTIDPLGTPERAFSVELADGRTIEGETEIVRETSVPIEGERRPSATVVVSTNLGRMTGHLNDWQPPP
jgi:hypothetical protein